MNSVDGNRDTSENVADLSCVEAETVSIHQHQGKHKSTEFILRSQGHARAWRWEKGFGFFDSERLEDTICEILTTDADLL